MSARLAVVIVNFNALEWLQRCLRTVYAQNIANELEVVVVDCASTDDSVAFVRREYPTCTLVASDENLGFGKVSGKLGRGKLRGNSGLRFNQISKTYKHYVAFFLQF